MTRTHFYHTSSAINVEEEEDDDEDEMLTSLRLLQVVKPSHSKRLPIPDCVSLKRLMKYLKKSIPIYVISFVNSRLAPVPHCANLKCRILGKKKVGPLVGCSSSV
jgi:hypothetical protein